MSTDLGTNLLGQALATVQSVDPKIIIDTGKFLLDGTATVRKKMMGYYFEDELDVRRYEKKTRLLHAAYARLEADGIIERVRPSATIETSIVEGAQDEDNENLSDLWSRLLAAACDPARTNQVRPSFIELIKRFDQADALVLDTWKKVPGAASFIPNMRSYISRTLNRSEDEIDVSFQNLIEFGLFFARGVRPGDLALSVTDIDITPRGRELVRLLYR